MGPRDIPTVVPFDESFDARIGCEYDVVSAEAVLGHFALRGDLLDRNGTVPSSIFTAVAEGAASVGTWSAVAPEGMAASGLSNDTTLTGDVSGGRVESAPVDALTRPTFGPETLRRTIRTAENAL